MTDVQTVFLCVGVKLLMSEKPIYANRFEIEAIDRLSASPEQSPVTIDWNSVQSRLHIASNETDANKEWWEKRKQ